MDTIKVRRRSKEISPKKMAFEKGNLNESREKNLFYPIEEDDYEDMAIGGIRIYHKSSKNYKNNYSIVPIDVINGLEIIEEVDEKADNSKEVSDCGSDCDIVELYHSREKKSTNHTYTNDNRFIIDCVDEVPFRGITYERNEDLHTNGKINLIENISENDNSHIVDGVECNNETFLQILSEEPLQNKSSKEISKKKDNQRKGFLRSIFQSSFLKCFGLRSQQKSINHEIIPKQIHSLRMKIKQ
uniref:Uncharacterized protein n=1 Tax=Strongyloides venezuelensis TaxID=75913 RepID=A0A0K0FIP1_STRVS